MLGLADFEEEKTSLATLILVFATIVQVIMMLNMLITIIGKSLEEVTNNEVQYSF